MDPVLLLHAAPLTHTAPSVSGLLTIVGHVETSVTSAWWSAPPALRWVICGTGGGSLGIWIGRKTVRPAKAVRKYVQRETQRQVRELLTPRTVGAGGGVRRLP